MDGMDGWIDKLFHSLIDGLMDSLIKCIPWFQLGFIMNDLSNEEFATTMSHLIFIDIRDKSMIGIYLDSNCMTCRCWTFGSLLFGWVEWNALPWARLYFMCICSLFKMLQQMKYWCRCTIYDSWLISNSVEHTLNHGFASDKRHNLT